MQFDKCRACGLPNGVRACTVPGWSSLRILLILVFAWLSNAVPSFGQTSGAPTPTAALMETWKASCANPQYFSNPQWIRTFATEHHLKEEPAARSFLGGRPGSIWRVPFSPSTILLGLFDDGTCSLWELAKVDAKQLNGSFSDALNEQVRAAPGATLRNIVNKEVTGQGIAPGQKAWNLSFFLHRGSDAVDRGWILSAQTLWSSETDAVAILDAKPIVLPSNEQPMFGSVPRTPEMIQADKEFISKVERDGYSRAQGSDKSVELGWQYLMQKHDLQTAMKRFNQAWLLDPNNGNAYHGMAVIVMERDHDAKVAEQLFRRGMAAGRKGPNLLVDYGRFLLMQKRPKDAVPVLREATTMPGVSPDAQALLTFAYVQGGDVKQGCAAAAKVDPALQPSLKAQIDRLKADPACQSK